MKFAKGHFTPKNPTKYLGKREPIYRSSWELAFMHFCDTNPSIISWSSEGVNISYFNPLKQRKTNYIPDFIIRYIDANMQEHVEMIEIKPQKETSLQAAGKSVRNQAQAVVNQCKWQAAQAWCAQQGIKFRILTENDIFHNPKKKR